MNRREAAKLAAAAAAGSVAGKAARAAMTNEEMAAYLQEHGYLVVDLHHPKMTMTELMRREEEQRSQREWAMQAMRIQQAIELGDKTGKELGIDFRFSLHSMQPGELEGETYGGSRNFFALFTWSDGLGRIQDWDGYDPDPLTAVQKAREAVLEWVDSHNGEGPRELGAPWATPY